MKDAADYTTASMSTSTPNSTSRRMPKEMKHLMAGGIAGMIAKSFVAPIDRIKILYQVSSTPFRLRDVPSVASKIVKQEGFTALWKGNTATMIRIFPYAGLQFMVFNRVKSYFLDRKEHEYLQSMSDSESNDGGIIARRNSIEKNKKWGMTPMESFFAGAVAGAISVLCTYPLDLTRAQLAVLKKRKGQHNDFLRVLLANSNGGVRGLFHGITPTLLGMLPYAGAAFAINEQTKRQIYNVYHREPTVFEKMICGGLSGLVAQSITYPLEVTRRRMQTSGVLSKGDSAINILGTSEKTLVQSAATTSIGEHRKRFVEDAVIKSPSMLRVMKQVIKEQGVRGFFKGLSMNWVKGPISFAFSFTVFDIVKDRIDFEEERWRQTL